MTRPGLMLALVLAASNCRTSDPPIAIEGDPEIARIALAETARRYPGVEVRRAFVTRYVSVREVPSSRSTDREAFAALARSRPFWFVILRPDEDTLGGGAVAIVGDEREVLSLSLGK